MSIITWNERSKEKLKLSDILHKKSIIPVTIVSSWPLMSSPYPLFTIILIYIWFVLKVVPKYMKNRKPYDLSLVTRLYNIYQIIACTYFVYIGSIYGFSLRNAWTCIDDPKYQGFVNENNMRMYESCWYFMLLRLSEFLETAFFTLRKKTDQVSMLHIYHHISTVVILWLSLLNGGGFMELFIASFNSCVHIIMYSYYFLSSYKKIRVVINFIKPIVTIIQILQLFIIFGHCIVAVMPGCKNSPILFVQLVNVGFLIFMFLKFSIDTFIRRKSKSPNKCD